MTDDATTAANVDRMAILTAKLERESRATRYLLVICTAANVAVTAFSMKVAYEWLPPIMLTHFMEHMQEVVMTWRSYNDVLNRGRAASATAPNTTAK